MTLKAAIKRAITEHSPKYRAVKVWKITTDQQMLGHETMWIEVSVKRKPKPKKPTKQSKP